MGRPTALTDEIEAKIVQARSAGARVPLISKHVGVHHATIYNWLKWGNPDWTPPNDRERHECPEDRTRYLEFFEKWEAATAMPDMMALASWVKAAQAGDWRAAKEWMGVRHPQQYSPTQRVEHSGSIGSGRAIADLFRDLLGELDLTAEQQALVPAAIEKVVPGHAAPED